jgi:hypothetical protein
MKSTNLINKSNNNNKVFHSKASWDWLELKPNMNPYSRFRHVTSAAAFEALYLSNIFLLPIKIVGSNLN